MVYAVYEDGVFRPHEPVQLPEGCEVEFEPRVTGLPAYQERSGLSRVYDILARRYDSGETDVAERHNEHQP